MPFVFLDLYTIIRRCLHAPFEFEVTEDLQPALVSGGRWSISAGS